MLRLISLKKRIIAPLAIISMVSSWAFTTANAFPWSQPNLWQTMAASYSILPNAPTSRIRKEIKAYLSDKAYIEQLSRNAQPYLYYVYQETQKRHMPAEIALLPMVESDYYPFCQSGVGAEGLWQLMAPTAKDMKIQMNWWVDGRRDFRVSTKESLNFLDYLHTYYKGSWPLALAAYNSGQGTVNAAIRRNKARHLPTDYWSLKLPKETEQYVPKLLAVAYVFSHVNQYHLNLAPVANKPAFTTLPLTHPINLQLFADAIHVTSDDILRLNPQFRRWVTPPGEPMTLLVPSNKAKLAQIALQYITPNTLWQHYSVQSSDTLKAIAVHFGVSTITLQQINHLASLHVRSGQVLLIPMDYSHIGDRKQTNSSGTARVIHTMLANETLPSIAKQYHVTVRQLRSWNNIPARAEGLTNKKIIIWTSSLALFSTHPRHAQMSSRAHLLAAQDPMTVIPTVKMVTVQTVPAIVMNTQPDDLPKPQHGFAKIVNLLKEIV